LCSPGPREGAVRGNHTESAGRRCWGRSDHRSEGSSYHKVGRRLAADPAPPGTTPRAELKCPAEVGSRVGFHLQKPPSLFLLFFRPENAFGARLEPQNIFFD